MILLFLFHLCTPVEAGAVVDTGLGPRPVRLEPHHEDMDAQGYSDKVTFLSGRPVLILQAGDRPVVEELPVQANGILVAPSYLGHLERQVEWSRGLEGLWKVDVAACEDRVARQSWLAEQEKSAREQAYKALEQARAPVPFGQRAEVKVAGGVLVGVAITVAAAVALDKVEDAQ